MPLLGEEGREEFEGVHAIDYHVVDIKYTSEEAGPGWPTRLAVRARTKLYAFEVQKDGRYKLAKIGVEDYIFEFQIDAVSVGFTSGIGGTEVECFEFCPTLVESTRWKGHLWKAKTERESGKPAPKEASSLHEPKNAVRAPEIRRSEAIRQLFDQGTVALAAQPA